MTSQVPVQTLQALALEPKAYSRFGWEFGFIWGSFFSGLLEGIRAQISGKF